jgi:hypothetical protein
MSGYGDIIQQGRKTEKQKKNQKAVKPENGKTVKDDSANDPVNITIKVPRKSRQYWTSQCKLLGLTMTEVLVKALEERFGEPD